MRVVVATHGHCFDGLASAVVFTRLVRHVLDASASFEYQACGYGPGNPRPDHGMMTGNENAILDYRYCGSPKLTWYFDHHRTSFQEPGERAAFEDRRASGRYFHDPDYGSCTRLIADRGRDCFGLDTTDLEPLIHWADTIDTARFDSPQQAIDRSHAVPRMVSVIENHGGKALLNRYVPLLLERPLEEVAAAPEIGRKYAPIREKYQRFQHQLETESRTMGRVVFSDLTGKRVGFIGKFVSYALYPNSTYSVLIASTGRAIKISVGHNPWCGKPCDADISAICARHGGGGHPFVGGISFDVSELNRARQIAEEIASELAGLTGT